MAEAVRVEPTAKTALQVAAQVNASVDPGFVRATPRHATVPVNWSVGGAFARMAEKVRSVGNSGALSSFLGMPMSAEMVADVDLPSEEIGYHFTPDPIGKNGSPLDLGCLFLTCVFFGFIVVSVVSIKSISAFGVVALLYVAYISETVGFGPQSLIFTKEEQHSVEQVGTLLKQLQGTNGYVKVSVGINLDIIEFERVLDNSSRIRSEGENRTDPVDVFSLFDSKKQVLLLDLKYKYDLYSEREVEFVNHKISQFLITHGLPDTKKNRKRIKTSVLIVDPHYRSLPRVRQIAVVNPNVKQSAFSRFILNFWVHALLTCFGLAWIHRQILSRLYVDSRSWTCSKVFVVDYDPNMEFEVTELRTSSYNPVSSVQEVHQRNPTWDLRAVLEEEDAIVAEIDEIEPSVPLNHSSNEMQQAQTL